LMHEYDKVFRTYEEDGIIERVPEDEMSREPVNLFTIYRTVEFVEMIKRPQS